MKPLLKVLLLLQISSFAFDSSGWAMINSTSDKSKAPESTVKFIEETEETRRYLKFIENNYKEIFDKIKIFVSYYNNRKDKIIFFNKPIKPLNPSYIDIVKDFNNNVKPLLVFAYPRSSNINPNTLVTILKKIVSKETTTLSQILNEYKIDDEKLIVILFDHVNIRYDDKKVFERPLLLKDNSQDEVKVEQAEVKEESEIVTTLDNSFLSFFEPQVHGKTEDIVGAKIGDMHFKRIERGVLTVYLPSMPVDQEEYAKLCNELYNKSKESFKKDGWKDFFTQLMTDGVFGSFGKKNLGELQKLATFFGGFVITLEDESGLLTDICGLAHNADAHLEQYCAHVLYSLYKAINDKKLKGVKIKSHKIYGTGLEGTPSRITDRNDIIKGLEAGKFATKDACAICESYFERVIAPLKIGEPNIKAPNVNPL